MNDDLHISDELIRELESMAIRTSAGSFVKVDDLRRLQEKRRAANAVTDTVQPKTIEQAREGAKRFLNEQGLGPQGPLEPGRSISATEPHPSSRT